MLTRNINVQSGLCNETLAQIVKLVTSESDSTPHVKKLGLELVNESVMNSNTTDNIVYIDRQEENLRQKGVMRRQFPIKLAFACTIHKVQGMTTPLAVVSLKSIFEHGIAYVALSRVTSLSGLHILDMNVKKNVCQPQNQHSSR